MGFVGENGISVFESSECEAPYIPGLRAFLGMPPGGRGESAHVSFFLSLFFI